MKLFVIATLLVASCSAHYAAYSSQYQAQDGHGGYSYGYSDPLSSKQETKSHDGTTHGGYSYVDANGHLQSVKYIADPHNGFQIVSATNLPKGPSPVHAVVAAPVHAYHASPVAVSHWGVPAYAHAHGAPVPVQKTYEVLAAEAKHFQAHAEAKARLHHHHKRSASWAHTPIVNGVPVDTPEVQHEKQIHFAAHQRALAGQPANPILYHPQLAHAPAPSHYAPAPVHYNSYPSKHYEPAPAPVNGVPVDTAEVAHAKAAHFAQVAHAKANLAHGSHYAPAPHHHAYPQHVPHIVNGVPEETYEVKAEKAKHFALVAAAQSKSSHYNAHDDGSYKPSYEYKDAHYDAPQHYDAQHYDDGSYKPEYDNEHYYH